jgi:hypothetical protein
MAKNMTGNRQAQGNMIFLVSLAIGVVIAIAVAGLMFNRVLLERTRAQFALDALAISLAARSIREQKSVRSTLEEASRSLSSLHVRLSMPALAKSYRASPDYRICFS